MALQCERPACAEPAVVAYGFDPGRGVAWLEAFVFDHPHQGRLCRRHADAMVVPQGWWLEDRREADQLFSAPAASTRRTRRAWRPARVATHVVPLPLSEPAPSGADALAPAADLGPAGSPSPAATTRVTPVTPVTPVASATPVCPVPVVTPVAPATPVAPVPPASPAAERAAAAPDSMPRPIPDREPDHDSGRVPEPGSVTAPDPVPAPEPASADATPRDTTLAAAWTPTFVADDDLDGLLNATSPLLGRAFGRVKGSGTRQRAPGA